MSRKLDDLSDRMKPLVFEFLARCLEAQLPVLIVDTIRTEDEHRTNLGRGASWIQVSNHMDGAKFRNTVPGSDAVDVAPYSVFKLQGPDKLQWDASDASWAKIGAIGEAVGLIWGGRWRRHPDYGHFEHPEARDGMEHAPVQPPETDQRLA